MKEIKFKKERTPKYLLDEIEKSKRVYDGRISYNFTKEYMSSRIAIFSAIEFPVGISNSMDVHELFSLALDKAAASGILTVERFLNEINKTAKENLSKKENDYYLLSSMSLNYASLPFKKINFKDGVEVIFCKSYSKKFSSRSSLKLNNGYGEGNDDGYCKVVVHVKSKSIKAAYAKALDYLDFVRSIFCFCINSEFELMGSPYDPINKIMLGPLHTLHDFSGALMSDEYRFELNFKRKSIYSKSNEVFIKNVKFFNSKFKENKYQDFIIGSMIRYVRSLDSQDHSDALFKIWGALEKVVAPEKGNHYEKIVERCAFLYEEYDLNKQLLEHLRSRRNEYVHVGDRVTDSKHCCYMVQEYFRSVILFHLDNKKFGFDSLKDANEFLDCPINLDVINKGINLYKNVKKFRRY